MYKLEKIYKLCEYGIPLHTIERIKKQYPDFSENNILDLTDVKGVGLDKKKLIIDVLNSFEFKNSANDSIYSLVPLGVNINQIENLYSKGITIEKILNFNVEELDVSKQLKERLKYIKEKYFNLIEINKNERLLMLKKLIKSLIKPNEIISVNLLKCKLYNTRYPIDNYINDINELSLNGFLQCNYKGVFYENPNLKSELKKIKDSTKRQIYEMRLEGNTLSFIGDKFNLTRERVRQIIIQINKKFVSLEEDKYKNIFEKYNWNIDLFSKFYKVEDYVYRYLDSRYNKGRVDLMQLYNEENINNEKIEILDSYFNVIEIYDERIKKTDDNMMKIFLKNEAVDKISSEVLYEKYLKFCDKYNIDGIEGLRNFESVVSRKNYIINNFNRQYRYYDINRIDEKICDKILGMFDSLVGQYSTLYFFRIYNDLMQKIDIRDEYEFHNLIRILNITEKYENMELDKMPYIDINIENKFLFYEDVLKELAPVTVNEAACYFDNEYGHKIESSSAYIRNKFSKYIVEDIIAFDLEKLDDNLFVEIKNKLTEDLYTIVEAKKIFKEVIGENYINFFNSYNLETIGYKLKGEFIQSEKILNLENYILDLIKDKKVFQIEEIPLYKLNSIYNIIRNLESKFDIIKFGDNQYVNVKLLENVGISREKIVNYGQRVYEIYEPGEFFNLYSFRNRVGENEIDDAGFEDCFYESLIFNTKGVKKISLDNNSFFYISSKRVRHEYNAKDLIKDIIGDENVIKIDKIFDIFEEDYGVKISNQYLILELVKENKFYYNPVMDKVYIDKEYYYDELFKGE